MYRRRATLLVISLLLIVGFSALGGTLTGSWENKLTLTPRDDDFFSSDSDLTNTVITLDYSAGELDFGSVSTFGLDGFTEQEFTFSGSVGEFGLASDLVLDPDGSSLSTWESTITFTESSLTVSDTFLLKSISSDPIEYGSGMAVSVSGSFTDNVTTDVTAYFGMDEDKDIDAVSTYGGSSLHYVSTIIDVNGLSLGCCEFDNKTKFSEASGFEYTKFEFYIYPEVLPLTLSSTLKFSPSKSITISPSLDLDWACFDVYTELDGDLTGSDGTIDSLTIEGFSLTSQEIGGVSFSAYTALKDKTVYDLNSDLLENYTYTVDGSSKTATFDEAVLLDYRDGLDLDLDTYLNMFETDGDLFNLVLLKGIATFDVSDQFSFGTEFYILSDVGLDRLGLTFDYSF